MTLQDRYQRYYLAQGYAIVPAKTRKYIVLHSTRDQRYLFLGKAGAVRVWHTPKPSDSLSLVAVQRIAKSNMERWERDALRA